MTVTFLARPKQQGEYYATTITKHRKGKYLYRTASIPMPSLFSLVLVLLLLLIFYLSSRVFTGVKDIETKNATTACGEATRDGGTSGASSVLFCSFSCLLNLTLLPGYLLYRGVGFDRRHGGQSRFDR